VLHLFEVFFRGHSPPEPCAGKCSISTNPPSSNGVFYYDICPCLSGDGFIKLVQIYVEESLNGREFAERAKESKGLQSITLMETNWVFIGTKLRFFLLTIGCCPPCIKSYLFRSCCQQRRAGVRKTQRRRKYIVPYFLFKSRPFMIPPSAALPRNS